MTKANIPNFILVTGLSGSGKSTTLKSLEDQGYYCVDNMPITMLPELLELLSNSQIERIATSLDIRNRTFLDLWPATFKHLQDEGRTPYVLFLEASEEILIRRYAESRRQHPFLQHSLQEALSKERELVENLRAQANLILDTSNLSIHQLRGKLFELLTEEESPMELHISSFGYKYGMPLDVDLVIDCRFVPNPYYVLELRPLSGLDQPIKDYLATFPAFETFRQKILDLLLYSIPLYFKEGKRHLDIALGCTGGRHRSVALAESLAESLQKYNYKTTTFHRDLYKKKK
ncbi:RNase adapter RapZ [bacterium]|nr:RNase adapter RapZ [bacterium]